ncbi:MAG: hypothetical protein AVDCRST_MAG02-2446, partial [uncultured Rubrobacteraceae bacterium]
DAGRGQAALGPRGARKRRHRPGPDRRPDRVPPGGPRRGRGERKVDIGII